MWLLKTEPTEYSYDDLERDGSARWDGVANPAAQRNLRAMCEGDGVLVYHTGDEKAVVGLAQVVKPAYPDPADDDERRVVIDIAPRGRLARPLPLSEIKELAEFAESPLVRQGRLSVVPITPSQWKAIEARARG
jgi:predicted RNA-binding protein with PUA-like domain